MNKNLAAKTVLVLAIMASTSQVNAGIPVIDGAGLVQNTMTAMEAVAQTTKQIQQYQMQLQQYENQLQNTMAPTAYIWDQAQSTMSNLRGAIDTLNYYKNQLGSTQAYLDKYQDVAFYRSSPCFSATGCTDQEWSAMKENQRLASEAQKKANDAAFKNLSIQQDSLASDAQKLVQIQTSAQNADGQLAAIGYANQLASAQTNQLMQIRVLLISQQNMIATQSAIQADKDARNQASEEKFTSGTYQKTNDAGWSSNDLLGR